MQRMVILFLCVFALSCSAERHSDPERDVIAGYPDPSAWYSCELEANSNFSFDATVFPDATVTIYADSAVVVLPNDGASAESASLQATGGREAQGVAAEIRFSNPSDCQVSDEPPQPPQDPGRDYGALAFGDLPEGIGCEELAQAELFASVDGNRIAENALIERLGEQGCDQWDFHEDRSEMTDENSVFMTLYSDYFLNRFGNFDRASLHIRCMEQTTAVYVNFGTHLGNDGDYRNRFKNVLLRLGADEAESQRWATSTDGEAVGLWRGAQSIPFLRRLSEAEQLLIRVTPDRAARIEAKFYLHGISDHVPRVAEACGWEF